MLSVFRKKSSFTIILFSVILIAGFLLVLISYCFVNHRYMKKTSVGVLSLVILLSAVPALVVFARDDAPAPTAYRANEASLNATSKEDNGDDKAEYKLLGESEENGNATSADRAEEKGNSTSSEASEKKESSEKGGDLHRSEVARFVETLLDVADRDDGIGEEVRTIAREQASSSEKIADAVNQIEQRSGVKTFLIGSDYKNIGAIRSEIAQTENRIAKLDREIVRAASSTDVMSVQAELASMKAEQTRIEEFVKANESKFSLFGWLVRLFQ